ncbi:hypothetical protein [Streptomyces sp. NPDC046862]|uniref:hypothetical protein n=1 Tax=Streptomyces sp. NPDC046862 TaxID=3154603 RepID=UPI003454CDEF
MPQPQPPYGGAPYGSYPPPPPPGGSGKKVALIAVGAVVALALVGGGVFLASGNGDDDAKADKTVAVGPSASGSPTGEVADLPSGGLPSGGATEVPDLPSPDFGDDTGPVKAPPAPGVEGQWQDADAKTLTVGTKYTSGDLKGKYSLSYIDTEGKGVLTGLGTYRDDDSFRLVLRRMGTQATQESDLTYGTVRRSGDDVVIKWDDGGTETLAYIGSL